MVSVSSSGGSASVEYCVISDATRGNSVSRSRITAATTLLESASDAGSPIRAVVLTGDAGSFCSGGDVAAFDAAESPGDFVGNLASVFHRFVTAITEAPVPVIAAVEGWAAGAGMSVVCAADIVVAGPSSGFVPAYSAIGLSPDGGMTWTLPRIVGYARARDLLLSNTALRGEDAARLGLVTRLVDDEKILPTADKIARQIATGSRSALGAIKELMAQGQTREFAPHLDAEARSIALQADSADGKAGVAAFLTRTQPKFR